MQARSGCLYLFLALANDRKVHSVYMGDVNYQDRIENNRGIVMGHAHSTATDGVKLTGSTINVRVSM